MAEQQDQRYDIARAQLSPRERRDLDRDTARAERKGTYDTNAPKSEDKRARAQMMKDAAIAYEMDQAGESIPKDGLNELGQPVSTLGMSENDKFFAIGRAEDKQALKGYQSYGDKYLGEARNAVREITGRAPIANTPDEFGRLLDKSVAFGGDSSLLTPEGRTRAMKQGVGAGLSYQEADAAVQGAFDFLSKKYGKKETAPAAATPSVGVPPLLARPEENPATPPTPTVQPETKPPEPRDTSPDASASASHRARLRGRAAEGKPTEVQPDNMGKPTGPPAPSSAIPVKNSLGTVWTDSSGYTYPYKPAPINPDDYTSGAELLDMVGLPQAWSNLKSGVSSSIGGFSEEYKKAQGESPDTPLRSAAKGAWEFLKRAYPKTDWTKLQ
jgi:hypothetical protein